MAPLARRLALVGTFVAIARFAFPAAAEPVADAVPGSDSGSARTLLERAFANLYADDYIQVLSTSTSAQGGREMTRRLQITRKQSARPGKALVRFLAPADIRKTAVLILENEGQSDDLYVYLPAVRLTRHLSSAQRADAFFGTDLSYEDVEPKRAADYDVRPAGVDEFGGAPCTLLEIHTREGYDSTYDRMRSCIEPERALILWTEFFRRGEIVKRLEIDLDSVQAIGSRFIPFEMTVSTRRTGSRTRLLTETYDLHPEIPDELFTTWNLQAGDAKRDRDRAEGDG